MRSRAEVETEILTTRCALIAADAEAETQPLDPDTWALSDTLFEQLRNLSEEYALIPHPRLPSDQDGHTSPRPY